MPSLAYLFLLLSFIILVPIIPAYLLYRILPSTANVKGTLKGMEIKLSGAFAGYFALVLLVIGELPRIKQITSPGFDQVWEVRGQLVNENGEGIEPLAPDDIKLEPGSLILDRNGWFRATFATQSTRNARDIDFPTLLLSHEGSKEVRVDLAPETHPGFQDKRDEAGQRILLKPVSLKKPPAYSTSGPAPQRVDPSTYSVPGNAPQGGSKQ